MEWFHGGIMDDFAGFLAFLAPQPSLVFSYSFSNE